MVDKEVLTMVQALDAEKTDQFIAYLNGLIEAPQTGSKEPRNVEQARQQMKYLYLPDITDRPGCFYFQAVKEYVIEDSFSLNDMLDWAIMLAYSCGIMQGKRIERAKKK